MVGYCKPIELGDLSIKDLQKMVRAQSFGLIVGSMVSPLLSWLVQLGGCRLMIANGPMIKEAFLHHRWIYNISGVLNVQGIMRFLHPAQVLIKCSTVMIRISFFGNGWNRPSTLQVCLQYLLNRSS